MAEPKIFQAINEVMESCGAVGKDAKNQQHGYKYRGIDALMNAINPALRKAKVFASPEVLESTREERYTAKGGLLIYSIAKVKYTFYAEDGSNVSAIVIGEGMDSGDKSFNKAMSAAYKYALFQVFCVPTEEMVDSEVDSPEPLQKAAQSQTTQNQTRQTQRQTARQSQPYEVNNPTAKDVQALAKEVNDNLETKARLIAYWNKMSEHGQRAILDGYKIKTIEELTPGMCDHWSNSLKAKNIAF